MASLRRAEAAVLVIVLISLVIGVILYPKMPDTMASHWNQHDQVDGYMSRFWGVFLMPVVMLLILVMFIIIPKIDPLKKNIEKFRPHFDGFILLITAFMLYIYNLTIAWNLGYRFRMGQFMTPALGILLFYCGVLIEHAERNWFIGIRTPWTLSSEKVWKKTHALGAKLFKGSGVIALIGAILPDYIVWLILVPVLLSTGIVVVYSYLEYQKLPGKS